VAVKSPVGEEMSAGSTAGPRPLVMCRDVRREATLLPFGSSPNSCSFWSSPTNYSLSYRSWLSVL